VHNIVTIHVYCS